MAVDRLCVRVFDSGGFSPKFMKKIITLAAFTILLAGCSQSNNDSAKIDALSQKLDMVISNQAVINGKLDALPETINRFGYFYYTNEVNLLETYNTQDAYFTGKEDTTIVNTMGKEFASLEGKIDFIATNTMLRNP